MKNYLLSLTTAALLAGSVQAQVVPGIAAKKAVVPSAALTMKKAGPNQVVTAPAKAINGLARKAPVTRVDEEQRPHKELSYQVNGNESINGSITAIGFSFDKMAQNQCTGIGFAQQYTPAQLARLAGNTITTIAFTAWKADYTDVTAFVLDAESGEVLWETPVDLKMIDFRGDGEYNVLECNYVITGEEKQGIVVGWAAKTAAPAAGDPYYAQNGIITTTYNDYTNIGLGGIVLAYQEDNLVIYDRLGRVKDVSGNMVYAAADILCMTEGDAAIPDTDASALATNPIRAVTGQAANVEFLVQNCGLDPVTSIECEYSLNGKTFKTTKTLDTPALYLQTVQVDVPALVSETAGRFDGTVEIIKVNNLDDSYITDNDNITDYSQIIMDRAYNRVPVYEVHNCTFADYADDGVFAIKSFAEAYPNGIPLHGFIKLYSNIDEPLESASYKTIIQNYYQGMLPAAMVNREFGTTNPYQDMNELVQVALTRPSEASITLEADMPGGFGANCSVDAKATIAFSTNAEAGKYGVAFLLTEDDVEVPVFSYIGLFVQEYMKQGADENWLKNNLGFTDEQIEYGKAATQDGNYYFSTTPMDGVVLGISDPVGSKTLLPAIESGQEYEIDFQSIPYSGDRTPSIVEDNLNVVALVIDQETGIVVSAVKTPCGTTSEPSSINTVSKEGEAQITVLDGAFGVTAKNATAEVYTADGRLVTSCTVNGQTSLPTFGQGAYIIRVVEGNKVISKKAVF